MKPENGEEASPQAFSLGKADKGATAFGTLKKVMRGEAGED